MYMLYICSLYYVVVFGELWLCYGYVMFIMLSWPKSIVYKLILYTITRGLSGPENKTCSGKRSRYFRYLVDTIILVKTIHSGDQV